MMMVAFVAAMFSLLFLLALGAHSRTKPYYRLADYVCYYAVQGDILLSRNRSGLMHIMFKTSMADCALARDAWQGWLLHAMGMMWGRVLMQAGPVRFAAWLAMLDTILEIVDLGFWTCDLGTLLLATFILHLAQQNRHMPCTMSCRVLSGLATFTLTAKWHLVVLSVLFPAFPPKQARKRPAQADSAEADEAAIVQVGESIVEPDDAREVGRLATVQEKQEAHMPRAKFCTHPDCGRVYIDGPGHKHSHKGHCRAGHHDCGDDWSCSQ